MKLSTNKSKLQIYFEKKILNNSIIQNIFYLIGLIVLFVWLYAFYIVFIVESNNDSNLINSNSISNIPNEISNNNIVVNNKISDPTETQIEIYNNNNKILKWPPVLPDGNIPEEDGYDILTLTELKVPKFWKAPEGADINKIGDFINNQETIYLMIASYRDFQCRETIASAFNKADHPERLFVGAVDQVVAGDIGCLDNEVPCSINPDQPLCKYRNQISVYKMDAQFGTGPVTARHIGDRMYRGQYFVMQMDAHCLFVRHWDTKLIDQWKSTGNEMAVLTSYMSDIQGSLDSNGDSTRNSRPIMCNSDFEGAMPARYLRHGAQPEDEAVIRDMPQLQPFWAAGLSFSRAHFKYRVPYDGYQPMVFQGEEISVGIRGFTFGYDYYAPRDSVVFHEYAQKSNRRKKVHMFWENSNKFSGEGQKSLRRATAIIKLAPDIDPNSWDHTEEDKYGLGTERSLELFYKVFLINPLERKSVQLCPFVRLGSMHRTFQKYLRRNGLGIDYSQLVDYDTRKTTIDVLKKQLKSIVNEMDSKLTRAIQTKGLSEVKNAVNEAERIGYTVNNSDLLKQCYEILENHS